MMIFICGIFNKCWLH